MSSDDVTELLRHWGSGNEAVRERLFALVYDGLRKIARSHLRRERSDHTLQPTALVHEAYMRLIDQTRVEWQNRAQFLGIASQMMRRILVDHARARRAERRGGGVANVTFEDALQPIEHGDDLVRVHDALEALAKLDPGAARVIELRYFGGLTIEEVAEVMGTSASTVKREWTAARTWLFRELTAPRTSRS
jgi:RNA polymerase sigma factor (TIGR02999 family)